MIRVIDVNARSRCAGPHEAGLGERELERLAVSPMAPIEAHEVLAAAEEVTLGQRHFAQDTSQRVVAGGNAVVTGRLLVDA